MEKKYQKTIILFFLLFFFLSFSFFFSAENTKTNQAFAQEQELEIEYPEIEGLKPETVQFPLTYYFKYVFTFSIWASGFVALSVLIYGGIKYLTSSGKPEELTSARKRILSAFLGIIILFSVYIILGTINPELVKFQLPGLESTFLEPSDMPPPVTKIPELLSKIKEIGDNVIIISTKINDTAEKIQELTDECTCERTQSLCLCEGGSDGDSCQPLHCYAGPPPPEGSNKPDFHPEVDPDHHHPCPDFEEIKDNQKRIIAWKDEILYYRNRALAEEKDLRDEIDDVLEEKIGYYQKKLETETDERVIADFEEEIQKLNDEMGLKENLADQLNNLADSIIKVDSPASEIGILPDECLVNVGDTEICKPACEGECHDFLEGCQPKKCEGENPCPADEIQNKLNLIQDSRPAIEQICQEILNIRKQIIDLKTISI